MTYTPRDAVEALRMIARAFEQLGVRYCVGGSIASSAHGLPRTTMDADVTAAIAQEHAAPLESLLGSDFYYDPISAQQMIRQRQSFNVIYLPKMLKIDIFPTDSVFDDHCLDRAVTRRLDEADPESALPMTSPEDIILHKLVWYRMGGGVSERQWSDVINVLKVQAGRLDEAYLDRWADDLDVFKLLRKARDESRG